MKYKCLVLDHDDTVVKSTPTIHYPSFIEAMKKLRPNSAPYTLEQFVEYCFDPGFHGLCKDILKYNDCEIDIQQEIWNKYTSENIPMIYDGFSDLIQSFKNLGGYICVVSHSKSTLIKRDYRVTLGIVPDMVFGWEYPEYQRKPNPYPLYEIMKHFALKPQELLVVDDLKPGLDMAKSCKVDFACAGWSHMIPSIKTYMKDNSDYYFTDVEALSKFIQSS